MDFNSNIIINLKRFHDILNLFILFFEKILDSKDYKDSLKIKIQDSDYDKIKILNSHQNQGNLFSFVLSKCKIYKNIFCKHTNSPLLSHFNGNNQKINYDLIEVKDNENHKVYNIYANLLNILKDSVKNIRKTIASKLKFLKKSVINKMSSEYESEMVNISELLNFNLELRDLHSFYSIFIINENDKSVIFDNKYVKYFLKTLWEVLLIHKKALFIEINFDIENVFNNVYELMIFYFYGYYLNINESTILYLDSKIKEVKSRDLHEICKCKICNNSLILKYLKELHLMQSLKKFSIHDAIKNNNVKQLYKILNNKIEYYEYSDINEMNLEGLTPLYMSIFLCNYDIIEILCDHSADMNLRNREKSLSPLEYGIVTNNIKLLNILIPRMHEISSSSYENELLNIHYLLKNTVNFFIEINLEVSSKITNFFNMSSFLNDKFKIYKQDGNLRIDMKISKNYISNIYGQISILIVEKGNKINVFYIDNEAKTCTEFFKFICNTRKINEKRIKEIIDNKMVNQEIEINISEIKEYENDNEMENIIKNNINNEFINKNMLKYCNNINKIQINGKFSTDQILLNNSNEKEELNHFNTYNTNNTANTFLRSNLKLNTNKIDITDEDYFTEITRCFDIDNLFVKKSKHKELRIESAINKEFPLKLSDFSPILKILSLISPEITNVLKLVESNVLNHIPLITSFPLGFSFYSVLKIVDVSFETINESIFDLCFHELDSNNSEKNLGTTKFCDNSKNNEYKEFKDIKKVKNLQNNIIKNNNDLMEKHGSINNFISSIDQYFNIVKDDLIINSDINSNEINLSESLFENYEYETFTKDIFKYKENDNENSLKNNIKKLEMTTKFPSIFEIIEKN